LERSGHCAEFVLPQGNLDVFGEAFVVLESYDIGSWVFSWSGYLY
jgi:hypothetical protein